MQPPVAFTSSDFTQTQPVCGPAAPVQTSNPFSLSIYSQTQPGCQPAFHAQTSNIFSVPTQTSSAFNLSQPQPASSTGLPTVHPHISSIVSVPTHTSSTSCLSQTPASTTGLPTAPAQTSNFFSIPTQTSNAFNLNQAQPGSCKGLSIGPAKTSSPFFVPTQTSSAINLNQTLPASSNGLIAVSEQTSSIFSVPPQTPSAFNLSQIKPASSTGLPTVPAQTSRGTSGDSSLGSIGHLSSYQSNEVMQPVRMSNPFGTLPSLHQLSPGPVQYGISRMPLALKSAPIRTSPLSAPRHLSQRRINLPVRKYNPKSDEPKVPFFTDNEERKAPSVVDRLFTPRENPRSSVTGSIKQWPPKPSPDEQPTGKDVDNPTSENAYLHPPSPSKPPAKVYEHGDDVEALMPKLSHADYYTEPQIQELAAKERARPGFCRHVKDFVVGRHGYGCIKFYGETDVRRLDIESIIQFNNREVIVYEDGSKKPPIGQGLNKAAEVTLLNVKCIKKGQHYTEGRMVEKYKDMLKKAAEEQGAEFVSFDVVKGLWKFRVQHF